MAYQKGKLNQEFLSVASLGNNQPTGIIQKATDGYAKNAYGKPIDNGGFLTELNLLGKSEQNKEEVNEYSISGYSEVINGEEKAHYKINGYSEVVKSENLLNPDLFKTNLDTYSVDVANITENIFLRLWVSPYAKIIAARKILLTNIQNNGTIEVTFTITQTENVRIQIGYDSDGVVINDIELQSGTYSITTSYTKTENIIKFSNLCLRSGNDRTYIHYFEPYIKNCGIKNIMKSVVYESTTVRQYAPLVAFNTNVHKGHKYYLQYEIFKEGLSGLYANRKVFKLWTPFPSEVGIHSYIFTSYMDLNSENNTIINQGHNFGFLTDKSGGLQLEGNGVSDYIGNFILVDCTGIEAPKETLPSNLEYNQYYIKTSDNTLINLGETPLRLGDTFDTRGKRENSSVEITLNGSENEVYSLSLSNDYGISNFQFSFLLNNLPNNEFPANHGHITSWKYSSGLQADTQEEGTFSNQDSIYIRIKTTTANTVALLKEWLAENPITIEYKSVNTTIETNLPSYLLPSNLTFTDYYKDNLDNTSEIYYPYAYIKNAGIKNYFDKSTVSNNKRLTDKGNIIDNNSWNTSDFINVENQKQFTFMWTSNESYVQLRIIGYDTSNNFVKIILDVNTRISTNLALNFIIDDSIITKLRISYSFKVGNIVCERNNIMLLNGTYEYFNTYIPYDSHYYLVASDNTLINLGTEPLRQNDIANTNGEKVVSRNSLTIDSSIPTYYYNSENLNGITLNIKGKANGRLIYVTTNTNVSWCGLDENGRIYVNFKTPYSTIEEMRNSINGIIVEYESETETKQRNPQNAIRTLPTGLSFTDYHKDNITNTMTTITTPTANFPEDINSLVNPIMNYNINNINITIPYTLRSINENNVSDYIKIEKDKVILVQCVGEWIGKGNENWDALEDTEHGYTTFSIYSGLSKQKDGNSAYCNWYKNKQTHGSYFLRNGIFMVSKPGYLILRDDYFKGDLTLFKNYLKENPLKIQYILETPIETDITNTEFGNNILNFVRNDFKGGDSYFTLNDSNNNLVHLKYYSTDYQENGEPTTAEKDPITNRYTILIQPIIDNKGIEADVDWVKKEVIY